MELFDKIFKRKTNTKMNEENLPSFWEDDYCQIEIVPRKNIENTINPIKHRRFH